MILEYIIVFILLSYGITNIIVNSYILSWFRNLMNYIPSLGKLFSCMMCTAFWVGLSLGFFAPFPLINPIFDGFIASGSVWVIHVFMVYFGADLL